MAFQHGLLAIGVKENPLAKVALSVCPLAAAKISMSCKEDAFATNRKTGAYGCLSSLLGCLRP